MLTSNVAYKLLWTTNYKGNLQKIHEKYASKFLENFKNTYEE